MAPRKSSPFHPECLQSCSQTCSLPSHCHTRSQHVQSRRLGWGCGGGSWACEIPSVLHLDASDELHSVLGQDSSALFPCASSAQRAWLDLSGGGVCVDFLLPNLSGVSAELKSCFDSLALLAPPTQLNFTNHTILHIPVIRIPDSNKAA